MNTKKSLCIACGVDGLEPPTEVDVDHFWLREDPTFGLGLCYECGEFVQTWDQGARDVRLFRESLSDDPSTSLLSKLVSQASLPSFPHVLLEIYKELDSEVAGIERIVPLIESDPGLTARTLRLGNSAYYARSQQYTQIKDVVTRVGPFDLWSLLVATEVKSIFYGINTEQMDMEQFWKHSLYTACASRRIAEGREIGQPGDLFIAGLLHDLGKLLLLQSMPIEYQDVLARVAAGEDSSKVEDELLGVNHAQVGGALFSSWNFPELLIMLTQTHHLKPSLGDDPQMVLHLANRLSYCYFDGGHESAADISVDEPLYDLCADLYERLSELVL